MFGVTCHVKKETSQSNTNIQFIVDALSGNSQGSSNLELQIQSILIRRGNITYDIIDKDNTKQLFNPNHINIDNISGKLSIKHYSKDSINAQINKLSFSEISGLNVNKLSANITGNRDSVCIDNFTLILPGSSILIPSAGLQLGNTDSLSQIANKSLLTVSLAPSKLAPKDFASFTPLLKDFSDVFDISADISGSINSISLNKLILTYGKELSFSGSMDLKNTVNKSEELYLFGQVKHLNITTEGLRRITKNFSSVNIALPEPIMNLEKLNFTGEISGFTDNLVAFGNLSSPIGSVQMDMLIGHKHNKDTFTYLKGNIASSDLQISSLFQEGNPFGKARFNAEIDFIQPLRKKFSGTVNAQINEIEYRGYNYENIYLSGKFKDNEYEGLVHVNDPNGKLEMQGLFRNEKEKSVFDFMANVRNFHPDKLHLTDKFENTDISFGISANFTGNNPDDFSGYIDIEDLFFSAEKDSFTLKDLRIETSADEQTLKHINISSNIINGEIKGIYSFSSLIPNLYKTVEIHLPSLINSTYKEKNTEDYKENNVFDFNITIENTESISNTLKLPVTILEKVNIHGNYSSITNSLFTEIDAPLFNIGKVQLEKGNLRIDNSDEAINLQLDVSQYSNNDIHNFIHFTSDIKNDRISTKLFWKNDIDEQYEAEIAASTLFIEEPDSRGLKKLRTEITILPAQIILKDTLWNIEPASVTISDGNINIDNFYVTKENQHLHINGVVSNNPKDILFLDLKDIEISYIFNILNKPSIQFGGRATGTINARDLFGSMMIDGRLEVQDFSFHNAVQGKLNLSSEWDNERQGILLLGSIYKNDSTWTDVNGYIFPIGKEQGLSLYFDAKEINIAFLQKYMNAFADSVSGRGFGNVHLYGSFSNIFLEGTPYVKDGNIKVNLLNTSYTFSDTVYLERQSIRTNNTIIYDRDGNTSNMDFTLKHSSFKDMTYNLDIKANKMLVYDIPERINPEIYGKVYASGTAKISGTEENIYVEGNIRSEAGTSVGFNFSENSTVEDYDFISFIEKNGNKTSEEKNENEQKNEKNDNRNSGMDYMLNFLVNVTPDAQIELIMDPVSGDKIRGNGNGNLQIQYGSQNDIQIFGNYLISGGAYNFSLQQVIRKRFNIRDGSIVSFRGDPMTANLDINATYNLTANIQDLDETLIMETANPNIMVNCVLQLNGRLQNPAITFDLELPNSNSELERQVKSFIDTEDMMTRQIIYLLVLNKFYTPDYSRNDYKTNEFSAVASSALSAQLSNILSSLTDKVQIGTNIRSRQDGVKDTEVEMLLSSQLLNNRLLFNGNFGYKDNYIQSNAFVGEFDLEYKLTRSGEISLKAYNHANDLYRYSQSLTRQGVGVMFRKDFTVLSEIFRRKKNRKKTDDNSEDSDENTKILNQASASPK
ncbi:MAG: translocation/assembly module TamB [Tannerella sp.]|nr:translocation/assembly module TamB [Tannerella sp.]